MFKKISAFVAALTITATAAGMLPANAEDNYNTASATETNALPSSVDLSQDASTKEFFPEIGNQGSTASCASFASTYYQFTYEMRKAYFNKYGLIPSFIFSPQYTFNHINGGVNSGVFTISEAYDFIKNNGALTLDDAPFITPGPGRSYEYDYTAQEGDPKLLCKALKMHLTDYHTLKADDLDDRIRLVKEQLNEGKIVATDGFFNDNDMDIRATAKVAPNKTEKIIVQNTHKVKTGGDGHAFVIVGYNDDLEYMYNGQKLKGAFKIANSWYDRDSSGNEWGDKWGNDGFMWVAYDSLREESEYGIKPSKQDYERVPGLGGKGFNSMTIGYTIDVEIRDIKLMAEANIKTEKLSDISLNTFENSDSDKNAIMYEFSDNAKNVYEGSVVENIDSICGDDYFSGKTYTIQVKHHAKWLPAKTTVNYVALRDDLGKVVAKAEVAEGAESASLELNLQRGDVDYDGTITYADRDAIRTYIKNRRHGINTTAEFSALQRDLMDVNGDKKITDEDVDIIENQLDALYWAEDGKYIGTQEVTNLEWNDINGDWYFLDFEGKKVVNQFIYDARWNGNFFVDEKGHCIMSDIFTYDGKTYYADANGVATEV